MKTCLFLSFILVAHAVTLQTETKTLGLSSSNTKLVRLQDFEQLEADAINFAGVKMVAIDFEETLTKTSLWQYLGGSKGKGLANKREALRNPDLIDRIQTLYDVNYGPDPSGGRRHTAAAMLTGRGPQNAELADLPEEVAQLILNRSMPDLVIKDFVNPDHASWGGDDTEYIALGVQWSALQAIQESPAALATMKHVVFGDEQRLRDLAGFLSNLGKHKILLVTNAYAEVMYKALQMVGMGDLVDPAKVIGREKGSHEALLQESGQRYSHYFLEENQRQAQVKDGKTAMEKWPVLMRIKSDYDLGADDLIFVDDSESHIEGAEKVCRVWRTRGVGNTHKGGLQKSEFLKLAVCVTQDAAACTEFTREILAIDFEETLTSTSLWQYLGGSFGKPLSHGRQAMRFTSKAMSKVQQAYATFATEHMLDQLTIRAEFFVNPNHATWNGEETEKTAMYMQLAALQAASSTKEGLDDIVKTVFGGKERVQSLAGFLAAVGRSNIYLVTNAYKSVMYSALEKVGLAEFVDKDKVIGREEGPGSEHYFVQENQAHGQLQGGLVSMEKWPVLLKIMEKDNLQSQDLMFVDDSASHIKAAADKGLKTWRTKRQVSYASAIAREHALYGQGGLGTAELWHLFAAANQQHE